MKKEIRLSALRKGEKAIISSFLDNETGQKMIELGCIPGKEILMERKAPLGDPLAVFCADTLVSIRRSEAKSILVETIHK